ncbi:MAG: VCBS repeat-containing protein [Cyclobacteriaceae bacterium]|nr:VCBS repeat-containing protein [Cyclobacteriaceae bacterium]
MCIGYLFWVTSGCQISNNSDEVLFTLLDPAETRVDFVNRLDYQEEFNIYRYRNFYNGGGVALGDINNDGLIDIYFTSNMHKNRLYLNKGDFQFEDITEKSGAGGIRAWSTGVSMADVNGDGLLDIYVCNSGDISGDNKQNELFINNGDLTFTESAAAFGIDDRGFSTHGAFFDYDRDGDLDLYLLNNSYQAIGSFNLKINKRLERDSVGGDKLYRNDGGRFTDVSMEAGIYSSVIGFGLGVTVGDINQDGWFDIYVSNDFFEKDYIYINNQDGTFAEKMEDMMKSISAASMGADMADVNNDGYPDIFVTDMLPEHDARLKTKTTFDNWERYKMGYEYDYYHQFTRNMFHLNNGDGTFSEIGRLAGVDATDWSWGALIFDMDNDGLKDLFVANGIYQDLTDQDYIQYFSNREVMRSIIADNNVDYVKLIGAIPSVKVSSYAFKNKGNFSFENKADDWGLGRPSHSNGSAYGDLDNDGDLDLVINNVNETAFIYKNQSREKTPGNHFISFHLKGEGKNPFAIGASITIKTGNSYRYIEQMPMRGFQSTVDHRPLIGLGNDQRIDTLVVEWPDGRITLLEGIKSDTVLGLHQSDAKQMRHPWRGDENHINSLFKNIPGGEMLVYRHIENDFSDFDRDRLIYHMNSTSGPRIARGDVNNDGLEDIYIGGAKDSPGALYILQNDGSFLRKFQEQFDKDKVSEDTDAAFFDADQDGDLDLYVTSGGSEFPSSSTALIDRLYFNDGTGNFTRSEQILPTNRFESSSCVQAADFDEDGIMELFVGIRMVPFYYGVPANGYLLENDGHGKFHDVTENLAPELKNIGMITDMEWADIDQDGDLDMVLTGEWMPITVFRNDHGKFVSITAVSGLKDSNGWWNSLAPGDFDGDGDIDFVVGNHGRNSRFKASKEKPVSMYVNDFDRNGTVEQIITTFNGDTAYPLALKHDLLRQLPFLQKKYLKYEEYKNQTITDIFSLEQLDQAVHLEVYELSSAILMNQGNSTFDLQPLDIKLQFSPLYAFWVGDVDHDQIPDILAGGNLYRVKPEVGRYDASYGAFLKGNGDGTFTHILPKDSGFKPDGEIRDILNIKTLQGNFILVSRNNDSVLVFQY